MKARRVMKIFSWSIALMVLLLLMVFAWVLSPVGISRWIPHVEARLSDALDARVMLEDVSFSWPLRAQLGRLQIEDRDTLTVYLRIQAFNLRISARSLLKRQLIIRELRVQSLQYNEWPAPRAELPMRDDIAEAGAPQLGLPASIGPITEVSLERLVLESVHWQDVEARFEGRARIDLANDLGEFHLAAATHNEQAAHSDLTNAPIWSGHLSVSGQFLNTRASERPLFQLEVNGQELLIRDRPFHHVLLNVNGLDEQIDFGLDLSGTLAERWEMHHRGSLLLDEQGLFSRLRLDQWSWTQGDLAIHLKQPAAIDRADTHYALDALILEAAEGRLKLSGTVSEEQLDIAATVDQVPVGLFGLQGVDPSRGELVGALRIKGAPDAPEANLELVLDDLLPADASLWEGPPARFAARFVLGGGRLKHRFELDGLPGDPVVLDVDMPLQLSLWPLYAEWPPQGDVYGRLTSRTDLADLATLFVLDIHRLSGQLVTDLELSGTIDKPTLFGHIRVDDGAYENDLYGTVLRDLYLEFSGDHGQVRLDRFSATDGGRGTLELSGALDLEPANQYPFEGRLRMRDFRLVANDTMQARGRGDVSWEGNLQASRLHGEVQVSPVNFDIPERAPASIIDLNVVEMNGDREGADEVIVAPERKHQLNLDLAVIIPDRFFVRGRGLDSEWSGRLAIAGTARDPVVTGTLSIERGRFVFFGKRLALTRGIITFDGSTPPQPGLDIVAEARTRGVTAIMRVSGAIDTPDIELDSVPEMPQDEILARLLFGREAARITPFQAITIAQAVNRLRGTGSTFDLMGETRRRLGVDQIEIRDAGDDEGQVSVSVGKYVTDRVFVEIERGAIAESTRAAVEVELTPTIRLESDMGVEADAGIGINWTWDF